MDNMINLFMALNGLEIANRYICLWHLGIHVKIPQQQERGLRSKSAYSIMICNPHLAQLQVVQRSQ